MGHALEGAVEQYVSSCHVGSSLLYSVLPAMIHCLSIDLEVMGPSTHQFYMLISSGISYSNGKQTNAPSEKRLFIDFLLVIPKLSLAIFSD